MWVECADWIPAMLTGTEAPDRLTVDRLIGRGRELDLLTDLGIIHTLRTGPEPRYHRPQTATA